ncbi:hypothetical protein ABZY58_11565 [Micromonospora tulbaghiae]|uniref:hypothetical protein n=1 Tax=Micromonospora tulbaghiae TaxID=479978 RepID=UPI0033BF23D0
MNQVDGAPAVGEGLALLRDLAAAAREEVRDFWVRYGERRGALVLVGPRLWQMLATTVARAGEPFWRLDRVGNQVVGMDGTTRLVCADLGPDDWQIVLLTDRRGSAPSS